MGDVVKMPKKKPKPPEPPEKAVRRRLKLSSPREIRQALARVANMVLNEDIDPKQANSIILACNAILGGIRTDEQQKRIDELEELLMKENEKGRS